MNSENINKVIKEIETTESIAIRLLRDTIVDYRRTCRKLIIATTILSITTIVLGVNFIFSIL